MYNNELKNAYIAQKTSKKYSMNQCRIIFEMCEPFEEEFGGDLCTMPLDQLTRALKNIPTVRGKSFLARLSLLRDYCSWCKMTNVPGACLEIFNVQISGAEKINSSMVSGPMHLQKCLDEICDKEIENTIDCIYRCFYWLAFAGMKSSDILRVCGSNVDFENMEVHFEGRDYPIYRESIDAFRNAASLKEFVYKNPTYNSDIVRDRVDGDLLMRGIRGMVTEKSMRVELSRRSRKSLDAGATAKRLSYYRIWLSGLFFRLYERERAGYAVNFAGAAEDFMIGREYKLDSGRNTIEAKRRQIMRDFQADYDRWKLVFMR